MNPDYHALHDLARRLSAPPSANGRDAAGRFAPGNPGGPGNPFARRTAQLREALLRHVSEQDIAEVGRTLLLRAPGRTHQTPPPLLRGP
jgi:hypothetical protein